MEIISPEKWSVKTEMTVQERLNTQLAIKKEAERICKRRKDKAADLENQVNNLSAKKMQLESFIKSIKDSLSFESDPEKKSSIEKLCNELNDSVRDYQLYLKKLQERFANQKIRILAFGSRSQGKSSFIKAYTGLSEEVISVKGDGKNEDWTGATSIIIHKEGIDAKKPDIFVVFKDPQSIIDTVNVCFEKLELKYRYSDWNKLYQDLRDSHSKKQLYEEICSIDKTDDSCKSTLKSIFKAESDFSDIEEGKAEGKTDYFDIEKGKRIEIEDLPKYNYMQNPECQKYMAVAEIHILADLKHGGMFENMEVCDTKGTSVAAGGDVYEKELYSVIGSSDAVFSIQMAGCPAVGEHDEGFYVRLKNAKNDYGNYLKDLDLRHFAIINMFNNSEKDCFKGVFRVIKDNGIANTAYAGVLKEGAVNDGKSYSMSDFVDYVIHDMMKKIVETTNQTDENLLKERESFEDKIRNKKEELVKQLHTYDSILPRNEDEIIRDSIGKWIFEVGIPEVENIIISSAKEANVPLSFLEQRICKQNEESHSSNISSEYDDFNEVNSPNSEDDDINSPLEQISYKIAEVEDQKVKEGIFEIITGDSEFPSTLKGKNNNEIVNEALLVLYNRIKQSIGKKKYLYGGDIKGSYTNIGAYIDDASSLISHEIIDNVNRKFAPDRDMPGSQTFKDKLFNSIWNALKLDIIYKSYNGDILKKTDKNEKKENTRLEHWSIPYNLSATIPSATPILPPPSYVILKHYFDLQSDASINKKSYNDVAVDEKDLIRAIQEAYMVYDIPTRYKLKRSEEYKWKTDLCQHLWTDIEDSVRFSEELIELFRYACPHDFVHNLTKAGIVDEKIEAECKNQNRLLELQKQRQNLLTFQL